MRDLRATLPINKLNGNPHCPISNLLSVPFYTFADTKLKPFKAVSSNLLKDNTTNPPQFPK